MNKSWVAFFGAFGLSFIFSGHANADCKAEVDGAFEKLRAGKAFNLTTKITNDKQGALSMSVDYVLPDRMHQRVTLGDSPTSMETIVVGTKVWSNQGQGWAEVPANFAEAIAKQMQDTVAAPSKSKVDYECLGDQDFEGKTYAAYRAALPAVTDEPIAGSPAVKEKPGKPNQQTLYVDKQTGLPARNIVTAADASDKRLFDGVFTTPQGLDIKEPSTAK